MAFGALRPEDIREFLFAGLRVIGQQRAYDLLGRAGYRIELDRAEANARAHALLMRYLTPQQGVCYRHSRVIWEKIGDRWYGLSYRTLQVEVWDSERQKLLENWCVYLPNTPREDTLVAQLLLLRCDPAELRKDANVTRYNEDGSVYVGYEEINPLRDLMWAQRLQRSRYDGLPGR